MNYSREQIYDAMRAADKAGDGDAVRKLMAALDGTKPEKRAVTASDVVKDTWKLTRDLVASIPSGAGAIGATLLSSPQQIREDITGSGPGSTPRREAIDEALRSMGADTNSLPFQVGRLGTQIAGTAGVGPAVAGAARALPAAAKMAPYLQAVESAGMKGGSLAARTAGGATTGVFAAGAVDPGQAGAGGIIGGMLPGGIQAAGKVGGAVGRVLRGPEQAPDLADAITKARGQGYVIPPSQARPSITNRTLEGFSGKITTAQNASAKNQEVTNKLAAKALGLADDTKITPEALKAVRDEAGQAYAAISNSGTVTPGAAYTKALDAIEAPYLQAAKGFPDAAPSPVLKMVAGLRSDAFDAGSAVSQIKRLRDQADTAYRTGDKEIGRAAKAAAKALEDAIEEHLGKTGATDALDAFRKARTLIAKTYTVEKALNPTSGTVDARKLAAELKKGKPLSGELKDVAGFAARFPKAAQPIEGMGSLPQTSPLDWALGAGLSGMTMNPLMMATTAARPLARSAVLSGPVQNRLIQQPNALSQMLADPVLRQNLLRAGPVIAADR